jgi:hypothetical protein
MEHVGLMEHTSLDLDGEIVPDTEGETLRRPSEPQSDDSRCHRNYGE